MNTLKKVKQMGLLYKYIAAVVLCICTLNLHAQVAYYDAMQLTTAGTAGGKVLITCSADNMRVLAEYAGILPGDNISAADSANLIDEFNSNPFIKLNCTAPSVILPERAPIAAALPLPGALGGLDVTTIADGVGKFLAKRTKEELNVAFFEKFNDFLGCHPEYKQLFPTTTVFLSDIYKYETSHMLSMLKAAFESDLKAVLGNLARIPNLDTAVDCKCNNMKQKADCQKRLFTIQAFFNTEYGRVVMAGLVIGDGAISKKNPAEIINNLCTNKTIQNMADGGRVDQDIVNALNLINILSASLRNNDPMQIWVSPRDIGRLSSEQRLIYLGLLYERIKNAKIIFGGTSLASVITSTNPAGIINYVQQLDGAFTLLAGSYKSIKADEMNDSATSITLGHAAAFISSFRNCMETGMKYTTISKSLPAPTPRFMSVFNYIDTSLQISQMVLSKNYYGAILSTTLLVDNIMQTQKDFTPKGRIDDAQSVAFLNAVKGLESVSKRHLKKVSDELAGFNGTRFTYVSSTNSLSIDGHPIPVPIPNDLAVELSVSGASSGDVVKNTVANYIKTSDDVVLDKKDFLRNMARYGNFMADIVAAKNSDDAEAAIEAMALPPGSASIKRTTIFNIDLQAYTGFSFANVQQGQQLFNMMSVSAPIGIAFNFGLKNWKNSFDKRTKGSASLFVSLFDVGAIVAYRFKDAGSNLSDTVKIRLENIFAPGANIVYGIPKLPISVGGGFEWQPSLERLSADKTSIGVSSGWRAQVFIAVDLPLLNLYTTRR